MSHFRIPFILLLFLMGMSGSLLFAQGPPRLDLEFRTDAEWKKSESKYDVSRGEPTLRFTIERVHLNIRGTMSEDIKYRLRVGFNETFESRSDGSGIGLEYWYVNQKLTPSLSWRLGKQFVLQGGREGSYNSMDVYGYSLIGEHIRKLYDVGISGIYEMNVEAATRQAFIVQIVNQLNGGHEDQRSLSYNFAWYGRIADGLMEPIIQFGQFSKSEECDKGLSASCNMEEGQLIPEMLISLGTKFNLDQFKLDFDILMGDFFNPDPEHLTTSQVTSLILLVKQVNQAKSTKMLINPFIKLLYDSVYQDDSLAQDLTARNEVHFGIEIFPIKNNNNYRFHALFISNITSLELDRYNEYRFNGGVSARFR